MRESIKRRTLNILSKGGRHLNIDMVFLGKGGFWLGIGQVSSSLSGLIVSVALANALPQEIFGTYKFILSLAAIIAVPALAGLNTALIRAIAQGYDGTIRAVLHRKLVWGAVAFFLGIGIGTYYALHGNTALANAVFIAAAFVPLMEIGNLYSAILVGTQQLARHARYTVMLYAIATILMSGVALMTDNLYIVLLTHFGWWAVGRISLLYLTVRTSAQKTDAVSSEALSLGTHLSIIGILDSIASHIDQLVLFHFLGPLAVARYAIAAAPVLHIVGFVQVLKPLAVTKFAGNATPMTLTSYFHKLVFSAGTLLIAALCYILIAPFLFRILFPGYLDAVVYTQVLSIAVIGGISALNSSILVSLNATRELYLQSLASDAVQIVLIAFGAYAFGLWGVLIAFVTAKLFSLVFGTVQTSILLSKKNGTYQAPV